jgi:transcriptional regulator with XRE-family HTH domain
MPQCQAKERKKMKIGGNIKSIRIASGLTQQALADTLGVDRTTIAKYETDDRVPDIEMLCKLADIFGTTTDELLGREM